MVDISGRDRPPLAPRFSSWAAWVGRWSGTPAAFGLAVASVAAWFASGPACDFSDTWQLVANTFTTLVTFLMVFLVQNTQNRETKAIHRKLDELILAVDRARNTVVALEQCTEVEIDLQAERQRREAGSDPDGR